MSELKGRLLEYTSPLITLVSVLMLLLFSRLRVGPRVGRLIAFFSPLTFGVYIIHVHHVLWVPLEKAFTFLKALPAAVLPWAVVLTGLAGFLACALVDYLRSLLFRVLRVSKGTARLEASLRRWLSRIINETNG